MKININDLYENKTVIIFKNGEKFIVRKKTSMDEYGCDRYNILLSRFENPEDNIIVNWLFPIDTNSPYSINNGLFVKKISTIEVENELEKKLAKRAEKIKKNCALDGIKLLEIIQKGIKTTLKYEQLGQTKYITVKYDKDEIDKDFSYLSGFVWCVYKLGNSHLSSNELQTKIKLLIGEYNTLSQQVYLVSYFYESGLCSPIKAKKIVNELNLKDILLKKEIKKNKE